uniref:Uncharacterized protein n=1 Tax=Globodera pallida TaxID=36090 RepID=A0A183BRT3_GLOPA
MQETFGGAAVGTFRSPRARSNAGEYGRHGICCGGGVVDRLLICGHVRDRRRKADEGMSLMEKGACEHGAMDKDMGNERFEKSDVFPGCREVLGSITTCCWKQSLCSSAWSLLPPPKPTTAAALVANVTASQSARKMQGLEKGAKSAAQRASYFVDAMDKGNCRRCATTALLPSLCSYARLRSARRADERCNVIKSREERQECGTACKYFVEA